MNGARTLLLAIRGPVLLVALGLLMAADQLDRVSFSRTWPVLLILLGLFKLGEHLSSHDHTEGTGV
ncbi:MAG TPA: DUF5668 domain-containing protein [Bryobacteraceae bacterium]|nr:DUF5668 domain-containing protein [Bryobacteraceae bacterium]